MTVILPLAAILVSKREKPVYTATAQVLLVRQSLAETLNGTQDPATLDPDRLAATQADIARVPTLANRVLRKVGVSSLTPDEFLSNSSVVHRTNTDLLEFHVDSGSRPLAVRLANAYADQFTLYRRELDTATLQNAEREVQQRINALNLERGSPLYANLIAKLQDLKVLEALQTANTRVVDRAVSAKKVRPRPARNGVFGLFAGLLAGLGLAFLRDALDKRVRNEEEITALVAMPLLGRLPDPGRRLRKADQLVMIADPNSHTAESVRKLRTMLEFADVDNEAHSIVVTSAVPREGKSTTAANLAVALARAGRRVVLVEADFHQPAVHRYFGVSPRPGITDVVIGHAKLDDALRAIPIRPTPAEERAARRSGAGANNSYTGGARGPAGFLVLPVGTIPPNPGEFHESKRFDEVLEQLQERVDVVLIDTPPLLAVGGAMAVGAKADGILLVVRLNRARSSTLAEVGRILADLPVRKLGFVLTGAKERDEYGYAYGYRADEIDIAERKPEQIRGRRQRVG